MEFIIINGSKGPEAAQVTGPNGAAVQGNKYALDRRPNARRFYYYRGPLCQRRQTQQDSHSEDHPPPRWRNFRGPRNRDGEKPQPECRCIIKPGMGGPTQP